MNQYALGVDAALIAIAHEPPETTPPDDDDELEVGFCWGCCRLEVDEEALLELDVDEVVSDEVDEALEVVEFVAESVE